MDGTEWLPYQASTFPTPPFAEYSSGHSTFSASGAAILRRFTGSDRFGASVTFSAGSSKFEAGAGPFTFCTRACQAFAVPPTTPGASPAPAGDAFSSAAPRVRGGGRDAGGHPP